MIPKSSRNKKREALYDVICENALTYGIAFASVEEIESINILNAAMLAMNRAIEKLTPQPQLALIDGNRNSAINIPSRCVIKGDAKCADIAAASILAKVTRDRYMLEMAEKYPEYHLKSTRATAQSCTTRHCVSMDRARYTARAF